ncbi:hypothetical protein GCM10027174_08020 [Salinifilum aidingensis]
MSKSRPAAPETGTSAARTRETARRARTRERLLDAAYRQFCAHGINGTSIEAITDDADFTRGAFYSNFGSKEELFLALVEREHHARLQALREEFHEAIAPLRRAEGKPEPELIEEVIADLLASQPEARQWCLLNTEFRLLAMREPQVAARFLEVKHAFQQQLAELIDTAMASIGLRFSVGAEQLTQILLDQFEATMQDAVLSGADDPERTARATIMRTLPQLVHSLTELRDDETR